MIRIPAWLVGDPTRLGQIRSIGRRVSSVSYQVGGVYYCYETIDKYGRCPQEHIEQDKLVPWRFDNLPPVKGYVLYEESE